MFVHGIKDQRLTMRKNFFPTKNSKIKKKDWIELTEETFNKIFEGSAVKRTKYKGLTRNIKALT